MILNDYHIHTQLSVCAKNPNATIQNYLLNAQALNMTQIGISNHFWDQTFPATQSFYKKQGFDHVKMIQEEILAHKGQIPVLFGCEAEYDYTRHDIAVSETCAREFDYILVPNSHTHLTMPQEFYEPYEAHAQYMVQAFLDIVHSNLAPYITAIAHPFHAIGCPYDCRIIYGLISPEQYEQCFKMAREKNIAIEINISVFDSLHTIREIWEHPACTMFQIAKRVGCKFIFGSDAHQSGEGSPQHKWPVAYILANLLNLTSEDVITFI